MNSPKKAVFIALLLCAPAAMASPPVIHQVGSLASYAAAWVSSGIQTYLAKAIAASRAALPEVSVTLAESDVAAFPACNHIVVEAKRLSSRPMALRGWSGPRKKQAKR